MKKLFSLLMIAIFAVSASYAQTAEELAEQRLKLNKINRKLVEQAPLKQAKKNAKKYTKQGWEVPAGEKELAQQITASILLGEELMVDANGIQTTRYYQHTSVATGGTYNTAYAAARNACQTEIAALIKTKIVAAMQSKLDNDQTTSIDVNSIEKFNQRSKSIVDACLTDGNPTMKMFRRLKGGKIEVQARLAYDKQQMAASLKRNLKKELEKEGDELESIVDDIMKKDLQ